MRILALLLAVVPLFVFVFNAQAAISSQNISLDLQITQDFAASKPDEQVYGAALKLLSPDQILVGETIVTGARSGSATVASFGFGLVAERKLQSSCTNYGNFATCSFPEYISVNSQSLNSSNPASSSFTVDSSLKTKLGLGSNSTESIALLPAIKTTDGQFLAWQTQGKLLSESGRVLAGKSYAPEAISFELSTDKNFVRVGKGSSVTINATLKLQTPNELDVGFVTSDLLQLGGFLAKAGNSGTFLKDETSQMSGVTVGVVGGTQVKDKCGASATTTAIDCDFSYKASAIRSQVIRQGQELKFTVTLDASSLTSMGVTKSSAKGELNEIQLIPVILLVRYDDAAFTAVSKKISIQLYDTQALADADSGKPAPTGVGANTSVSGSGTQGADKSDGGVLAVINLILGTVVWILNEVIYWVFSRLIGPFLEALLAIRTYTDTFANVIYPAWEIFRNLGNIFFILAIIAIGLGTIFRVHGWEAKDTLLKLVIGALLINFSLIFAQSVLGIADTVQNQFLPPNTGAIRLLADQLMIKGIRTDLNSLPAAAFGSFGETVRIMTMFALAVMAFIAFVSMALFLLIRLVFLWLLLMTSPIPYVAMILPVSKGLMGKWWSNFFKYAFMTPAMAFMLNLTALVADKQRDVIQRLAPQGSFGSIDQTTATVMYAFAANAVIIAFMYMTLVAAKSFGAESGGLIEKVTKQGLGLAVKAPLGAAGWLGGIVNRYKQEHTAEWSQQGRLKRVMFALANPITTAKAIGERRHLKKEEIHHRVAAGAYDVVPSVTWPFRRFLGPKSRKYAALYGTEYAKINKDENPWINEEHAMKQLGDLIKSGKTDEQTRTRIAALMIQLAEDNDLNDALEEADTLGLKRTYNSDRHGYAGFFQELIDREQLDHLQNGDLQARLTEIHKKNGTIEYMNQYRVDNETGQLTSIHGELKVDKKTGMEKFVTHDEENKKAWADTNNAIDKQYFKIGASSRANLHYSAWVHRKNPKADWEVTDAALEIATFADDRDWNVAESLNPRSRVRMIAAFRNPEKYKQAIERSVPIVAKKLRDNGEDVDLGNPTDLKRVRDIAEANLDKFTEKYLLYDVKSDTKLDRTQKNEGKELVKKPKFLNAINKASTPQSKRAVITYFDEVGYNRGSYKKALDSSLATKLGPAAGDVEEAGFEHMQGLFADKIDAIKTDLLVKDSKGEAIKFKSTDLDDYKKIVREVMKDEMERDPTKTMSEKETDLQNSLTTRFTTELKKSDGSSVTAIEANNIAKRIFGGFTRA